MKVFIYGQSSLLQKFCTLAFLTLQPSELWPFVQTLYNSGPWCAIKKLSWWKIAESVSLLLISKMYILAFFFLASNASPVSCCNSDLIPKSLAIIVK